MKGKTLLSRLRRYQSGLSGTAADVAVDVVVVGAGGAGLAAAVSAARMGRSVTVLEKAGRPGGTTGRAVGSVTYNSTPLQAAAGIEDSPTAHAEDLALLAGPLVDRDNSELRQVYTESAAEAFCWLQKLGVVFYGPLPEEPHRVPRMHNALPGSAAFISRLTNGAKERGARVICGVKANELMLSGGRVVGVVGTDDSGRSVRFRAHRGVILATGDYSSSTELKLEFMTLERARVEGINPLSTGDGHRLGRKAGGVIVNGDLAYGPELRFLQPPYRTIIEWFPGWPIVGRIARFSIKHMPGQLLRSVLMKLLTTNLAPSARLFREGAVLVNRRGERFCDELDRPALAVPEQPDGDAFIVFDERLYQLFNSWPYYVSTAPGVAYAYLVDYRHSRKDIFHWADTVADLAEQIGADHVELQATLDQVNADREKGTDAPKTGPGRIDQAPYYALGPLRSYISMTDGGLKVSRRLEVLDADERPIQGLFAAGSVGQGGVLLEGHGHHIGWAIISGRIAGESAAVAESAPVC